MEYAEIFLNTRPWAKQTRFIGLVAADSKSGKVKILRAEPAQKRRLSVSIGAKPGVTAPKGAKASRLLEVEAIDQFLASLERLTEFLNAGERIPNVAGVLKCIPDRGTSFQLSAVQSGAFTSPVEALNYCAAKGAIDAAPIVARRKSPVIRQATA